MSNLLAKKNGEAHDILEYGIQYPTGDVAWFSDSLPFHPKYRNYRLDIPEGRTKIQEEYHEDQKVLSLPKIVDLKFLTRIKTVSYSEPEEIRD